MLELSPILPVVPLVTYSLLETDIAGNPVDGGPVNIRGGTRM